MKHIILFLACIGIGYCVTFGNIPNNSTNHIYYDNIQYTDNVEFYGVKIEKASSVITKRDKKRKTYYNFYTDMDWGKASNYDLCINSKLGVENCVNVIVTYVKERFKIE